MLQYICSRWPLLARPLAATQLAHPFYSSASTSLDPCVYRTWSQTRLAACYRRATTKTVHQLSLRGLIRPPSESALLVGSRVGRIESMRSTTIAQQVLKEESKRFVGELLASPQLAIARTRSIFPLTALLPSRPRPRRFAALPTFAILVGSLLHNGPPWQHAHYTKEPF